MAIIQFSSGPHSGRRFELPDQGLVIGRNADVDITISDPLVSGRHAHIMRENGSWIVRDLESSNGTYVNGSSISSTPLKAGDVIEVGESRFEFNADPKVRTGSHPARPAAQTIEKLPKSPKPSKPSTPPEPAKPAKSAAPAKLPPAPAAASAEDVALVEKMRGNTDAIRREVAKVVIGQTSVMDEVLMCMIAGGHALLVGLPGLAKTLMISTIARVVDLDFKRIQFTPDLMPSDITGTDILETNRDTQEKEFRFIRGPIFCNLLLADEINRTPPKTQAALLEAMQEKRVTAGNKTFDLDAPFFVLATQNPIEQEGTYPLPEAQMDRFMFNIWVDYPSEKEEEEIVSSTTVSGGAEPEQILKKEDILQLQDVVRKIPVSPHVVKYAIRLVRATRPANEEAPDFIKEFVSIGAGPRAGQFLILAAKARAVLEGRIHVASSDIRAASIPVLRHRIYTNFAADSEGLDSMTIIGRLLDAIDEPGEADYSSE